MQATAVSAGLRAPVRGARLGTRPQHRRTVCRAAPQAYRVAHDPQVLSATTVGTFVAATNAHDVELLCRVCSSNVVYSDRVWSSSDLVGLRKLRNVYNELFVAYPDYTVHPEELLARPDAHTVALHFTARGTCFGEWRGFPPTGRRSTYSGVTLFTFDPERDDRIKQITTYRQPSAEEYVLYLGHEDL